MSPPICGGEPYASPPPQSLSWVGCTLRLGITPESLVLTLCFVSCIGYLFFCSYCPHLWREQPETYRCELTSDCHIQLEADGGQKSSHVPVDKLGIHRCCLQPAGVLLFIHPKRMSPSNLHRHPTVWNGPSGTHLSLQI